MAYRQVGYLEQCWYILKCWVKHTFKKNRYPKIKAVYINGEKNTEWKYDRSEGTLEFKNPIPSGVEMRVVMETKRRKRGAENDSTGVKQTLLHQKAH